MKLKKRWSADAVMRHGGHGQRLPSRFRNLIGLIKRMHAAAEHDDSRIVTLVYTRS